MISISVLSAVCGDKNSEEGCPCIGSNDNVQSKDHAPPPCVPARTPIPDGRYYFTNFSKERVWVGLYSSNVPDTSHHIGDLCYTYFTTNMSWYWNKAKQKNPNVKSIQIKWFYTATHSGYRHDLIWEGNKNSRSEWYTYGSYTTTSHDVMRFLFLYR